MFGQSIDNNDRTLKAWLTFVRDRSLSNKRKRELIQHNSCIESLVDHLKLRISTKALKADLQWLDHDRRHLVTINSEQFPQQLKEISDPPFALFADGDLALLSEPQVSMVGSRQPSPIGQACAQQIAAGLAELGIVINSGLALGIDGIAHRSALEVGGKSIAVLGGAFDHVSPRQNLGLCEELKQHGLVLSEYPLGTPPNRYTFPQRNRIVSGISLGVIIVEAAEKSGTLITARLALEHDRELMVVPGSALSHQYAGSNRLIQDGAALVTSAQDVLHVLQAPLSQKLELTDIDANSKQKAGTEVDVEKHALLRFIDSESTSVDILVQRSGKSVDSLMNELLELELKGLVARDSFGGYVSLQ